MQSYVSISLTLKSYGATNRSQESQIKTHGINMRVMFFIDLLQKHFLCSLEVRTSNTKSSHVGKDLIFFFLKYISQEQMPTEKRCLISLSAEGSF